MNLRELARRVGITSGAPYRHFSTKEELLGTLALEGFQVLGARMQSGLDRAEMRSTSPLDEVGYEYVAFALERPALYRLMFSFAPKDASPERDVAEEEAFELLVEAVRREQARGTFPAGQADLLALNPWSTAHGFASLLASGVIARRGFGPDRLPEVMRAVFRVPAAAPEPGSSATRGSPAAKAPTRPTKARRN